MLGAVFKSRLGNLTYLFELLASSSKKYTTDCVLCLDKITFEVPKYPWNLPKGICSFLRCIKLTACNNISRLPDADLRHCQVRKMVPPERLEPLTY